MEYFVARGNSIGPWAENLFVSFRSLSAAIAAGRENFGEDFTVWDQCPDTGEPGAVDMDEAGYYKVTFERVGKPGVCAGLGIDFEGYFESKDDAVDAGWMALYKYRPGEEDEFRPVVERLESKREV